MHIYKKNYDIQIEILQTIQDHRTESLNIAH